MRLLFAGDIRALHLKRYIQYFRSHNHQVASASVECDPKFKLDYQIEAPNFPDFLKYICGLNSFRKIISDFKPDLINCHFVPNYGLLGMLSRFHPVVISAWGSDILISANKSIFHKFRARKILHSADLVLTDAEMLTTRTSQLGVELNKIKTIPFGVEAEILEKGKARKIENRKQLKLISTRQLKPLYKVDTFVSAIGKLSSLNDYDISILGEGSDLHLLQEIAVNCGQEKSIFKGHQKHVDLITMLLDSDIYISCSESDSTSVSLLEAMACGCFPVVSDIEGNREWIADGENGLLFPVGDIQALADKIESATRDISMRQKAVHHNFELILNKAVWENNMAEVEQEFETLVRC